MAILHNKHTCNTAVAATTIVGSGNVRVWVASDFVDAGSKVFLVKRPSCTQLFTSHHQQHPNIQVLTHTRVIDGEGQASDRVVPPHQEPRDVNTERGINYGGTPPHARKKILLVTRYSSLITRRQC